MKIIFTKKQKKALNSIWLLVLIVSALEISNYFVSNYGPETTIYDYLWKVQNWLSYSIVFAWYFYKNGQIKKALLLQLLFVPYFIFRNDWSITADYYLDFDNSIYIYHIIRFLTFIVPTVYFSISYFKSEAHISQFTKKKTFLIQLALTLILSYVIEGDVDEFYKYLSFASDSLYTQDTIVSIIFILISIKTALVLMGFFYISNRIYFRRQIIKPIDKQPISKTFFKWGFIASYTIFSMSIIDLGSSAFSVSFLSSSIKLTGILYLLSSFFAVFVSGRFLGNLIQYRNYSQKRYFGVINSLSLVPILNLIPFFVLLFVKQNQEPIENYISTLKSKRNIHILTYSVLCILIICYGYFSTEADYRDASVFYKIPMFIGAVILLSRYRLMTKVVPFLIVIITYFEDIKFLFDFTEGFLFFIEDKIFSFIWLGTISVFLLYYILYYVIHKSFYTEYFEDQNEEEFEENIKQFQ